MQSINSRKTPHLARCGISFSRGVALLFALTFTLISFASVAPVALAADDDGSPSLDQQVNDAKSGKGASTEAQKAIGDTFRKLSETGEISDQGREVLKGLGGEGRNTNAMRDLFNNINPSDMRVLLDDGIMDKIANVDPGAADFLSREVIPALRQNPDIKRGALGDAMARVRGATPLNSGYADLRNHRSGELLASVIFSTIAQNHDGTAMSAQLPMSELATYPAADSNAPYGQLDPPSKNAPRSTEGEKIASYIEGLYRYKWLVGVEMSAGGFLSGRDDPNIHPGKITTAVMAFGELGAQVFDGVSSSLVSLEKGVGMLNIGAFFQLPRSEDAPANGNIITDWVGGFLDSVGLNGKNVKAIQAVTIFVIGTMFMIVLMRVLSGRARVLQDGRVRDLGTRIIVAILAIPFVVAMTTVVQSAAGDFSENQLSDAARINDSYVLDTLDWAAATNLSLGYAGHTMGAGGYEQYEPKANSSDVSQLNRAVRARMSESGSDRDTIKASEMFSKYRSGSLATVTDYFARIADLDAATAMGSTAASFVPEPGSKIVGSNRYEKADRLVTNAYFLSDRGQNTNDESSDDSDSDSDSKNDAPQGNAPASDSGKDSSVHTVKMDGGKPEGYKCEAMTCTPVKWNLPSTYIYGAVPASQVTKQTKNAHNYFGGNTSTQNRNPESGQEPDDDADKKVWDTNGASIAVMNKTAGLANMGGMDSLSTQSTAFLLQSTFDNGTLRYNGFQTSQSSQGYSSDAQSHGAFVRYVIPNTGDADLTLKITSLALIWALSGAVSVIVLISLFRLSILRAILNMFRGFFSALFLGNIAGLINYFLYYLALALTFVAAVGSIVVSMKIGVALGEMMGMTKLTSMMNDLIPKASEDGGMLGKVSNVITGGAADNVSEVGNSIIGSLTTILVVTVLTIVLSWPIIRVQTPNGGVRKEGLIQVLVSLPIMLADRASEYVDDWARKLSHGPGKAKKSYGKVSAVNQVDEMKERGNKFARATGLSRPVGAMKGAKSLLAGSENEPQSAKPGTGKDGSSASGKAFALATTAAGAALAGPAGARVAGAIGSSLGSGGGGAAGSSLTPGGSGGAAGSGVDAPGDMRDGVKGDVLLGSGANGASTISPNEARQGAVVDMEMGPDGTYRAVSGAGATMAGAGGSAIPNASIDNATIQNAIASSGATEALPPATSTPQSGSVATGAPSAPGGTHVPDAALAAAGAAGATAVAGVRSGRDGETRTDNLKVDANNVVLEGDTGKSSSGGDMSSVTRDGQPSVVATTSDAPSGSSGRDGGSDDNSRIERQHSSQSAAHATQAPAPTAGRDDMGRQIGDRVEDAIGRGLSNSAAAGLGAAAGAGAVRLTQDSNDALARSFERSAERANKRVDRASRPSNGSSGNNAERQLGRIASSLEDIKKDNDQSERMARQDRTEQRRMSRSLGDISNDVRRENRD